MQLKKTRNIGEHLKNNKAAWFAGTTATACTALILFFRQCGGPAVEGPMPNPPTRGDAICDQSEYYPYLRNSDGTIKTDGNEPIRNPYYSKEDCHRGDNVCDDDPTIVLDPAGNTVQLLGGLPLPLESADTTAPNFSPDCIRLQCGPQCGESGEEMCPEITRSMITEALSYLRQRGQSEIEMLHAQDDNDGEYFVVISVYEESCNGNLPMCSSTSEGECFCPNHSDCAPRDPPAPTAECGNGRVEQSEECDHGSRRGRQACDSDERCNNSCQCVQREAPTPSVETQGPAVEIRSCGSDVTGSGAAEGIETTVRGVVSGRANALREQMGASSSANVMVSVTL
ncbi:hypothetical protein KKB44_01880, partial [Candidatus Micrarchaeota archaeon]|nr:hypothetical protein [Candidatus Micrarchaeota archaeon]